MPGYPNRGPPEIVGAGDHPREITAPIRAKASTRHVERLQPRDQAAGKRVETIKIERKLHLAMAFTPFSQGLLQNSPEPGLGSSQLQRQSSTDSTFEISSDIATDKADHRIGEAGTQAPQHRRAHNEIADFAGTEDNDMGSRAQMLAVVSLHSRHDDCLSGTPC